jgi:hypothetical protein
VFASNSYFISGSTNIVCYFHYAQLYIVLKSIWIISIILMSFSVVLHSHITEGQNFVSVFNLLWLRMQYPFSLLCLDGFIFDSVWFCIAVLFSLSLVTNHYGLWIMNWRGCGRSQSSTLRHLGNNIKGDGKTLRIVRLEAENRTRDIFRIIIMALQPFVGTLATFSVS